MNVVIIDGDVSYPPTSGKRQRTLNLMLKLAERHRIVYLARADHRRAETEAARKFLEAREIQTILVHEPLAAKSGPWFYARLAANVLSPLPYSVASHLSRRIQYEVERFAARQGVDVWQCEWPAYIRALERLRRPRSLLIAHNVDSLIWQRYHAVERNPLRRWYIRQQWSKFQRFERSAFRQATRVAAVTTQDAELMKRQFGVQAVDVVENGVDVDFFGQTTRAPDPRQILFLGALDWRPNQDGVRYLLDEVFPKVSAMLPDAKLEVVGRNPPAWLVDRIGRTRQVQLQANVPDVRPALAASAVMIVPLRIGGGSRLKILEALASGLPVVSTGIGAEGLSLSSGQHWIRADTADELAQATVDCLRAPDHAQGIADQGRQVVRQRYDWDQLADRLEESWQKCAASDCAAVPAGDTQ